MQCMNVKNVKKKQIQLLNDKPCVNRRADECDSWTHLNGDVPKQTANFPLKLSHTTITNRATKLLIESAISTTTLKNTYSNKD